MTESVDDAAQNAKDAFLMLLAENARQAYQIRALQKSLQMAVTALTECLPTPPPLLKGHPIADWIDAHYRQELEEALRKIEDTNPALSAHFQAAMDKLHVPTDFPKFP